MKYPQKYGRQGNSAIYCSNTVTPYIARSQKTDRQKDAASLSPMLQDEILPWFEKKNKTKRKKRRKEKKRKLTLRVLNSKWKVSRSRMGSAQNFRLR